MLALTCSGVNGEPGRFVEHDKFIIFEENLEWNCLWPYINLLRRWLP